MAGGAVNAEAAVDRQGEFPCSLQRLAFQHPLQMLLTF
jgi:hypothetical protein